METMLLKPAEFFALGEINPNALICMFMAPIASGDPRVDAKYIAKCTGICAIANKEESTEMIAVVFAALNRVIDKEMCKGLFSNGIMHGLNVLLSNKDTSVRLL